MEPEEFTTLIASGFVRNIQSLFPFKTNAYFNIPSGITHFILSYLHNYFKNDGTYLWKIKDQSLINQIFSAKNGEKFESEIFQAAKLNWTIEIYPAGDKPQHIGYFVIYIRLISLPSHIENITFCRTFRVLECMVSTSWSDTISNGEHQEWTKKLPLSDLKNMKLKQISVLVELNVFRVKFKKYYKYIPSRLYPNVSYEKHQNFDYKLNKREMEFLNKMENERSMCSGLINDMWSLEYFPNGRRKQDIGNISIYLRLLVWYDNLNKVWIRYTITCAETGHQQLCIWTFQPGVSSSYGTHKFMTLDIAKKLDTITFNVEIDIASVCTIEDESLCANPYQIASLLAS
eukprot:170972_1